MKLDKLTSFDTNKKYNQKLFVIDALNSLKDSAVQCSTKFIKFIDTNDNDKTNSDFQASMFNFNAFVEPLRDLIIVLAIKKDNQSLKTLGQCIAYYKTNSLSSTKEVLLMADFLFKRNELVHKYYNAIFLQEEYLNFMSNYNKELIRLSEDIYLIMKNEDLLREEIW